MKYIAIKKANMSPWKRDGELTYLHDTLESLVDSLRHTIMQPDAFFICQVLPETEYCKFTEKKVIEKQWK